MNCKQVPHSRRTRPEDLGPLGPLSKIIRQEWILEGYYLLSRMISVEAIQSYRISCNSIDNLLGSTANLARIYAIGTHLT